MRLAAAVPTICATLPAWAFASKEFWEAKPPSEWNAEEAERMLTKSPWAKGAFPADNGETDLTDAMPASGGFSGRPAGAQTAGHRDYPTRSGSSAAGGNDQRPATVRWESALPVQEALRIGASTGPNGGKPNPEFEKYYVIALIGDLPTEAGHRRGGSGNSDGNNDNTDALRERRLEIFKESASLERKNGRIRPEKIDAPSGSNGPGFYFYFSRQDDISMDDKQVVFSTKLGAKLIKAKFTMKEMLYHGKLAI